MVKQINGVDVRHSKHEDIVKILTSSTDKVSLVAYRERVVNKKMRPMSEINGCNIKTFGECTKVRILFIYLHISVFWTIIVF